jgi:hypothetical protein
LYVDAEVKDARAAWKNVHRNCQLRRASRAVVGKFPGSLVYT